MRLAHTFPVGSTVEVGMRYRGHGTYDRDEWAGRTMFVVGHFRDGLDLKLASSPDGDWEVCCHISRLVENGAPRAEKF